MVERSRGRLTEIYLDWNATTPPHPDVLAAMVRAWESGWGNPASVHGVGRRARAVVEAVREQIARTLSVEGRDVVLTSGGTEANNLALQGVCGLATTRLEHPSVTRVAEALALRGVPVVWIPATPGGQVDVDGVGPALAQLPRGSTVALAAVNHESGVIQPVREVARAAWTAGARIHVDAVQALGKLPPNEYLHGDSYAVAAHKLRGPKGVGALAWRGGAAPRPVLLGGAQERGLRPGTQDAVTAAGFGAAIARVAEGPERYQELATLRDRLEQGLRDFGRSNGDAAVRAPHVLNVSFLGWRGDELVAALDLEGIRVSSGSACSAGTAEPSSVVAAMLGVERARSAVRFSLGETTTAEEIDEVLAVCHQVLDTASDRGGEQHLE